MEFFKSYITPFLYIYGGMSVVEDILKAFSLWPKNIMLAVLVYIISATLSALLPLLNSFNKKS